MHYENENCDTDDLNGEIDWEQLGTFSTTDIDMGDGTKVGITNIQGEISGTIEILESIPLTVQQQFFCDGGWHNKLTRRYRRRRDYVISRWEITKSDGSTRHTESFVIRIQHTMPWYLRIIAYFLRKREQRRG